MDFEYILYYSNYHEPSKTCVQTLIKTNFKDKILFLNVDNKKIINGNKYIILENGKNVPLPKTIKEVPSLIDIKDKNRLVVGQQSIMSKFINGISEINISDDNVTCYSFGLNNYNSGVQSDQYWNYDLYESNNSLNSTTHMNNAMFNSNENNSNFGTNERKSEKTKEIESQLEKMKNERDNLNKSFETMNRYI